MKYSNSDLLKRVSDAKRTKSQLTHVTNKSALSTEDRMKIGLCKHFVRFATTNRMLLKDMSKLTGIPISRLSEMLNYKIDKYTVDKLVQNLTLLSKHDPQIREYLTLLERAAELPPLNVKETQRLAKNLRDASQAAHPV